MKWMTKKGQLDWKKAREGISIKKVYEVKVQSEQALDGELNEV